MSLAHPPLGPVPVSDVLTTAYKLVREHRPGTPDAHAAWSLFELMGSGDTDWRERAGATHVTASVLLVHTGPDGRPRALLTLHPRFGRWMQLGGHLEPQDSSLADAALRETVEESGQPVHVLGEPVLMGAGMFHAVPCGNHPGGSTHLDVRFLVQTSTDRVVASDESDDLAWWPLDELPAPHDGDLALLAEQARAHLGK